MSLTVPVLHFMQAYVTVGGKVAGGVVEKASEAQVVSPVFSSHSTTASTTASTPSAALGNVMVRLVLHP